MTTTTTAQGKTPAELREGALALRRFVALFGELVRSGRPATEADLAGLETMLREFGDIERCWVWLGDLELPALRVLNRLRAFADRPVWLYTGDFLMCALETRTQKIPGDFLGKNGAYPEFVEFFRVYGAHARSSRSAFGFLAYLSARLPAGSANARLVARAVRDTRTLQGLRATHALDHYRLVTVVAAFNASLPAGEEKIRV